MWLGVIAHEQIVIVGVRPAVEPDVGAIVPGAPHRRVFVPEMTTAHVVVGRVDKAILSSVERLAESG